MIERRRREVTHYYMVTIEEIYDADTFRGILDKRWSQYEKRVEFRAYGIDSPELRRNTRKGYLDTTPGYDARDRFLELIGDTNKYPRKAIYHKLVEPIEMMIQSIVDRDVIRQMELRGKFGRVLFNAYNNDDIWINQALVNEGHADINYYDTKPIGEVLVAR